MLPELEAANAAVTGILLPEAFLIQEDVTTLSPGGYAAATLAQIKAGREVLAIDLVRARHLARRLGAAIDGLLVRCDAILTPTVAWIAPAVDPDISSDDGHGEMLASGFTNLTGHPSLSLPCGLSERLPVGLQLVGTPVATCSFWRSRPRPRSPAGGNAAAFVLAPRCGAALPRLLERTAAAGNVIISTPTQNG